MTSVFERRSFRAWAATAAVTVGLIGLAGCGIDAPETKATTEPTPTAIEPTAFAEPETTEEPSTVGTTMCSEEQLHTLFKGSENEIYGNRTASFMPAAALNNLDTVCVITVEEDGEVAQFAVVTGGAASIATVGENLTAGGAEIREGYGMVRGIMEGFDVDAYPFTQWTQSTAGFENVEDLVVLLSFVADE